MLYIDTYEYLQMSPKRKKKEKKKKERNTKI